MTEEMIGRAAEAIRLRCAADEEFVLTWVPLVAPDDGMIVAEGEPVEIPLNEHWVLPGGEAIGEFRLSTREAPGMSGG
ncbi:hypothetical protein [Actinophytocola sediminis]